MREQLCARWPPGEADRITLDAAFRFFAVPVKVRGLGSFPVRAFAVVE